MSVAASGMPVELVVCAGRSTGP